MNQENNDFSVLGLICARGGSKGVPGKNYKDFCGKPLIAWSVEAGLQCPEISDVVVSTDDQKIADAAKAHGAEIPFMRPAPLAQDDTKQIDAIIHAIEFLKEQGRHYYAVALLQPTCPLRIAQDVSSCITVMKDTSCDTVITVTKEDGSIFSTYYTLDEKLEATPKVATPKGGTLRQDYQPAYRRCGSVYLLNAEKLCKTGELYGETIKAVTVPKDRAFDIDTPFDWDLAALWMDKRLKEQD